MRKTLLVDNHVDSSAAVLMLMLDCCVLLCSWSDFSDFRFVLDTPLIVSHLIALMRGRTQTPMQTCGWRLLGVGLLIAGSGDMGPHIFKPVHLLTILTAEPCPVESVFNHLIRRWKDMCLSSWSKIWMNRWSVVACLTEIRPAGRSVSTKIFSLELLVKTWSVWLMVMLCLHFWKLLKKHHRERHTQPAQPAEEPAGKADKPTEH